MEFRMYNERTRQSVASARTVATRGMRSCPDSDTLRVMRDIPVLELQERSQAGRRGCDGTLRDEMNNSHERDCTQGRRGCDGAPRDGMNNFPERDCTQSRCGGWGLEAHPLAMVYSPCQAWRGAYTPDVALDRGTLFSELDLPFEPKKSRKGGI